MTSPVQLITSVFRHGLYIRDLCLTDVFEYGLHMVALFLGCCGTFGGRPFWEMSLRFTSGSCFLFHLSLPGCGAMSQQPRDPAAECFPPQWTVL